jgi:hypothetical protein
VISSAIHLHLEENKCLEIIAVEGSVQEVRSLSSSHDEERGKAGKGRRKGTLSFDKSIQHFEVFCSLVECSARAQDFVSSSPQKGQPLH